MEAFWWIIYYDKNFGNEIRNEKNAHRIFRFQQHIERKSGILEHIPEFGLTIGDHFVNFYRRRIRPDLSQSIQKYQFNSRGKNDRNYH